MSTKSIAILKLDCNSTGGLEKQTNLIAEAFLNKDYKVDLVTTKPKNPANLSKSLNVHFIKKWPFFSFLRILFFDIQATRWVKKNKPTIILGIDRTSFQTHIRAGNGVHRSYLQKRKLYLGFIDYIINKINPLHYIILKTEKKSFESSFLKKIIVNSNMVRSEILKYYKVHPSKIEVIHNGVGWKMVESDFLEGFKKDFLTFTKVDLNPSKYNFLFVGNGYKRKGLKLLLLAASKIKDKNFHISIVGKDKNINRYIKFAKKLGLQDNATFFGPQTNVQQFFQLSDALILPSFYDPFANVTVEALAMGLFTITSKENGAHEIITETSGIVINNIEDIEEIRLSLEKAMKRKKSYENALTIRNSISHLDMKNQLDKIIDTIITDVQS